MITVSSCETFVPEVPSHSCRGQLLSVLECFIKTRPDSLSSSICLSKDNSLIRESRLHHPGPYRHRDTWPGQGSGALRYCRIISADWLDARAQAPGKKHFGAAISTTVLWRLRHQHHRSNFEEFGHYTCEKEMKFDVKEPSRNSFSYTNADQAAANGRIMRRT